MDSSEIERSSEPFKPRSDCLFRTMLLCVFAVCSGIYRANTASNH